MFKMNTCFTTRRLQPSFLKTVPSACLRNYPYVTKSFVNKVVPNSSSCDEIFLVYFRLLSNCWSLVYEAWIPRACLITLVRACNVADKHAVGSLKVVRDCFSVDTSSEETLLSLSNTRSQVQSTFVHRASTLGAIRLSSLIQLTVSEVRACTQGRMIR